MVTCGRKAGSKRPKKSKKHEGCKVEIPFLKKQAGYDGQPRCSCVERQSGLRSRKMDEANFIRPLVLEAA